MQRLVIALAGLVALASGLALSRPWNTVSTLLAWQHPEVTTVDAGRLARWMRQDPAPLILDARAPAERAVSQLPGAIAVDPAAPNVSALPAPDGRRVVVYCALGSRSAHVAEVLAEAGWRDVTSLEGGIFAWANAGLPLVRQGEPVRVVHAFGWPFDRMVDPERRAR
mgnify:CR=1 FL=1